MTLVVWVLLVGCGEPATFEEPTQAGEVDAEAVAADGSERAPALEAPVDARPEEVKVKAPEPGGAWPPIVVPEGPREREWEWDFKHKGSTKRTVENKVERRRTGTLEEQTAYEMERQAELDAGKN